MKYGTVTLGQVEAAINKLGGQEVWDAWLRGEKTMTVEDTIQLLFERNGRRIPQGLKAAVCDAKRDFRLDQPKLEVEADFANRIARLHDCLSMDTGVTAEQLKAETERLLVLIRENSQVANIVDGVFLPVVLPKFVTDDLGAELELYLAGVGNSYTKTFGDRKFYNHRKGTLASELNIVDGSRQYQLVERMKQGPVIGIYFPSPLQGFSIKADREQMATLPEGFILSGLDTAIAMVMYPDVLARDYRTPGLDLAAFSWRSSDYSLCFGASDDGLGFDYGGYLARAYSCYSGGLLFLG